LCNVAVEEVKNPEVDAVLVAKNIAAQIENRISFKKLMKKASSSAMRPGGYFGGNNSGFSIKGIKICCKGRLNGAEIAREEWVKVGSVPLHTLRANIDYGYARAKTTYGIVSVRVWISKGDFKLNRKN